MAKLSVSRMPASAFGVEQVEQGSLLGVVGAGRIAGGGADAAILLVDQVVAGELFLAAVAPVGAGLLVQHSAKASASRSARALAMIAL